ncbi:DUF4124 domain-containing protein [Marinicella sp. W31]|uniref:DUF4124 domain-containing protein n=1 Tax=Marinicella sp. W31 TaxID=3023713 RepID=UPI0037567DC6
MKKTIVVLLFLCAMPLAAQKIYKWVDENGQVHYSSQKPPGQDAEKLNIKAHDPEPPAPAEEEGAEAPAEEEEADDATKAELAKLDKANLQRSCQQARSNLASLQNSYRVAQVDPKTGETVRLSDSQRASALKRARDNIKEFCK